MTISAHCLVKNEERFVWYSIMSVINYVDEILIWDNGSSDETVKIVNSINSPKIKFRDVKNMPLAEARNAMIGETNTDWIFVLDGDEIWYDRSMLEIRNEIEKAKNQKDCLVVPNFMLVGDIFHYQEKAAGRYEVAGKKGHFNVRAVRNMEGLHVEGVYGNEAYVTKEGTKIQNLPIQRILSSDLAYLHASFLQRTPKGKRNKFEIGEEFALDFYYPEVFFRPRPSTVPSVWEPMRLIFKLVSFFETPFRKVYRRTLLPFRKHGY